MNQDITQRPTAAEVAELVLATRAMKGIPGGEALHLTARRLANIYDRTRPFIERRAKYIGNACDKKSRSLLGKTAIVHDDGSELVTAQFDDTSTGFGFGWSPFPREEFEYEQD